MIKTLIKRIIYKEKCSSDTYIKYLRSKGMRIGENVKIYNMHNVLIDETRPFLIEIGNNVAITSGTTILTHGYDWLVFKSSYTKEVYGSAGKVKIGNNVFIGANTTILKGVTIGDNVVIGAGSVVTKSIPSDTVAAGNPAKVLYTMNEYLKKRKDAQEQEAYQLFKAYYERYNKIPPKEVFDEFFFLFTNKESDLWDKAFCQLECCGNFKESMDVFLKHTPIYNSFDAFINECEKKYKARK